MSWTTGPAFINEASFRAGSLFNIKISLYQYRKSHCWDKPILRPISTMEFPILIRWHLDYLRQRPYCYQKIWSCRLTSCWVWSCRVRWNNGICCVACCVRVITDSYHDFAFKDNHLNECQCCGMVCNQWYTFMLLRPTSTWDCSC